MKNAIFLILSMLFFSSAYSADVLMPERNGNQLIIEDVGGDYFFYGSGNVDAWIRIRAYGLRIDFTEGSYIEVHESSGIIKLFSSLTNQLESYSVHNSIPTWNVSSGVTNLLSDMSSYFNDYHSYRPNPVSGGDCMWVGGEYVCRPPILDPGGFISQPNWMSKLNTTSGSNCSFEQGQAAKPYAGHTTYNRCMINSRLTYAVAGTSMTAACVFRYAQGCAGGFAAWQLSTIALADRVTECQNSYDLTMHNLNQCLENGQNATQPGWYNSGNGGYTTDGGTTVEYGGFVFGGGGGGGSGSNICVVRVRDSQGNIVSETRTLC